MSEPAAALSDSIEALARTGASIFETWMRSMRQLTAAGLRMNPILSPERLTLQRPRCAVPPSMCSRG